MQRIRFNVERIIFESICAVSFAPRSVWYIISSAFHILGTALGMFMLQVSHRAKRTPLEAHPSSKLAPKSGERSGRHPWFPKKELRSVGLRVKRPLEKTGHSHVFH